MGEITSGFPVIQLYYCAEAIRLSPVSSPSQFSYEHLHILDKIKYHKILVVNSQDDVSLEKDVSFPDCCMLQVLLPLLMWYDSVESREAFRDSQ